LKDFVDKNKETNEAAQVRLFVIHATNFLIDKSEALLAVFILVLSSFLPTALKLLLLFLSLRLMDCLEDCSFMDQQL